MHDAEQSRHFRHWIVAISVLLILGLPLVYSAIVVELSPEEQAIASVVMIALAWLASFDRRMRPFIIFLSCFVSARYFYWRVSETVNLATPGEALASLSLLGAEIYGLIILFLGYFQTIEFVEPAPPEPKTLPSVDVYIATYNEPVDIVRRTLIGALAMDYPNKHVYVLDDGRRAEIADMVGSLGGGYITRPDNRHAKAGNLNHAMRLTGGELIAIFDADHVPVRSFIRRMIGYFEDPKVAFVQSAQHFFNPDPYERNLNLTGKVAPEQHFFYHVIQPGNDFWNSAFFCGSCAIIRRSALEEIGGIKTETVTEDAHTALELHARGYRSVYVPAPLAAGLATETFAAHVKQRMRWARGMAQIFRVDCPLFKRGLTFPQRLNYFNAMFHFFFGIPRLILVVSPFLFLLLGAHPIKATSLTVVAYILPHIGLATIANSIISKRFRHSFWAAVYELSIAPYTAWVTLAALFNPRAGKFHVTDKGTNVDQPRFDMGTSRFTVGLLAIALVGLVIAFPARLVLYAQGGADPSELDSILLNSLWALANVIILIATVCVGLEQPQQRHAPRIRRDYGCALIDGGETLACRIIDISESGVKISLDRPRPLSRDCRFAISSHGVDFEAEAHLVRCDWGSAGSVEAAFAFVNLDAAMHRRLVELIFTDEEGWLAQTYADDQPFVSLWHLITTFWRATRPRRSGSPLAPPLSGKWRAWYAGRECQCRMISGAGANIRLDAAEIAPEGQLRVELCPGDTLTVAAVSRHRSGGDAELVFTFQHASHETIFWDALYTAPLPGADPRKEYFWRWTEALK